MVELSLADHKVIEQYPLDEALDQLKPALRQAEQPDEAGNDSPFKVPTNPRRHFGVTAQLLAILLSHEAAFHIYWRPRGTNLNTELSKIIGVGFKYQYFRSLVQVVLEELSDVHIWTAVLNLISELSRRTPPTTSTNPSSQGTPLRVSPATQQASSEQTRERLLGPLKNELSGSVYQQTGGFFEKYFDGKPWSKKVEAIYKTVKKNHTQGRWKDFPSDPTQEAVWTWWDKFQRKHLCKAPGVYHTTDSKAQVTGTQSDRQLDILVKHRSVPAEGQHHAKHYRVVGELTVSGRNTWQTKFFQLATYVRDVFSVQPLRRFVHGFLLFGTVMELLVFDRSGAYSSNHFDIHSEPERFIRVIAGYALMSDQELGLDENCEEEATKLLITVDRETGGEITLSVNPDPIAFQRSIVTRGTCCFLSRDRKSVVKYSWASDQRRPEAEHLRSAEEDGIKGLPRLLGSRQFVAIAELRSGLTFKKKRKMGGIGDEHIRRTSNSTASSFTSHTTGELQSLVISKRRSEWADGQRTKKSRSNSVKSALYHELRADEVRDDCDKPPKVEEENKFRNRVLTCLAITPAGRPLNQFRTVKELLETFRDAIKQHRSLIVVAKTPILHRDVSENNIIITDPKENDGYSGMLIDYDLAVRVDDTGKNERTEASVMTGTLEYIALELLEGAMHEGTRGIEHTYRHDLESFFYVFVSVCGRYGWEPGQEPKEYPFRRWYTGTVDDIAVRKRGSIDPGGFKLHVLEQFSPTFQCLKGLALTLRGLLFREGVPFIGTPDQKTTPPATLYDAIISAFEDAIVSLTENNKSPLRDPTSLIGIEHNVIRQRELKSRSQSAQSIQQASRATRKRKRHARDEPDTKRRREGLVNLGCPSSFRSRRKVTVMPIALRRSVRIATRRVNVEYRRQ